MRAVGRFGPPIALMGLIFVLSAQPDLNSGLGLLDTIVRKLAHTAEFGLLWFLWLRALGYRPLAAVMSAVISGAYAATDELHQLFVHGRVASPLDWAIDCAGIGITWHRGTSPSLTATAARSDGTPMTRRSTRKRNA